jgi:hypothetical protein
MKHNHGNHLTVFIPAAAWTHGGTEVVTKIGGWNIADTFDCEDHTEALANARLIAAAPGLFEALKEIMSHLDAHSRETFLAGGETLDRALKFAAEAGAKEQFIPACKSARAALAKVTE